MKYLLIFFVAAFALEAAISGPGSKDPWYLCKEELAIDAAKMKGYIRGNWTDDEDVKEFLICLFKKMGFISESGKLQRDNIRHWLKYRHNSEEQAYKLYINCVTEKNSLKETVFHIAKCLSGNPRQRQDPMNLCKEEVAIDVAKLKEFQRGNWTDDEDGKEFLICLYKKMGFISENGELQRDNIRLWLKYRHSSEEQAYELYINCVTEKNSLKETVFHIAKCLSGNPRQRQDPMNLCKQEVAIDVAKLKEFQRGNWTDDEDGKEFLICFYKKMGFISERGELQRDNIRHWLKYRHSSEEQAYELYITCVTEKNLLKETVFHIAKCLSANPRPRQDSMDLCKEEVGIDVAKLREFKRGNWTDDEDGKEFLICLFKKMGFISGSGELQRDNIRHWLKYRNSSEEQAYELYINCVTEKNSLKETVFYIAKCFSESAQQRRQTNF